MTPVAWAGTVTAVVEAMARLDDADMVRIVNSWSDAECRALADALDAERAAVLDAEMIVTTADFLDLHADDDRGDR